MSSILIQNGKLFNGDKDSPAQSCDILVEDGVIKKIGPKELDPGGPLSSGTEAFVFDARYSSWVADQTITLNSVV